MTMEKYFRT